VISVQDAFFVCGLSKVS